MYRAYLTANISLELDFEDEPGTATVVFNIKEADYFFNVYR